MEYILKKGEVMSLDAALSPVIQIKNGVVWLTCTDDSRDHFLQRGCTYSMTGRNGRMVLESFSDCAFELHYPDAVPWQLTIQLTFTKPHKLAFHIL